MNALIDLCITTTIKLGTRTDRVQTMEDKVRGVQEKL